MTLLNPAGAILAAAIGVPILLTLYFLKLRRRPVRVSSTMLWERAVRDLEVNVPFRWIRSSVSLFLQLLAIAALALAIGRPMLGGAGAAAGGRLLILIDRSASMSALDGVSPSDEAPPGGGPRISRLDEARRRAKEIIASLGRSGVATEAMVGQFAASAQGLTALTGNRTLLDEAVDSITPTDQSDELDAALRLISVFIGQFDESARGAQATVVILSDGARTREPVDRVVTGAEVRFLRVGPDPDAPPPPANVGITALSARRDADDPALVRVFARVSGIPGTPASPTLRLRLDGEDVGAIPIEIPAGPPTTPTDPSTPAGRAPLVDVSATASVPCPLGGVLTATLPGEGDVLAADDLAALVIAPPRRPRVLVVAPGEPATAKDAGADVFLRAVLRELDLARLDFSSPAAASALLADADTAPDLVIFDRVSPASLPTIPSICFACVPPLPGLSISTGARGQSRVLSWKRNHPALRYVPLETVIIDPPVAIRYALSPVTPALPAPAGGPQADFTTLADGDAGPLIGLLELGASVPGGVPTRHVIVAFPQERANWGPSPAFPVFLSNTIDFLTLRAEAQAGRSTDTKTAALVTPALGLGGGPIAAAGPISVTLERGSTQPGVPATLGVLERAGVYRVSGVVEGDRALAVNLCSAQETDIRTGAEFPISGDAPSGRLAGVAGGGSVRAGAANALAGTGEIWHWFIALAIILLSAEWLWLAWRMRL